MALSQTTRDRIWLVWFCLQIPVILCRSLPLPSLDNTALTFRRRRRRQLPGLAVCRPGRAAAFLAHLPPVVRHDVQRPTDGLDAGQGGGSGCGRQLDGPVPVD